MNNQYPIARAAFAGGIVLPAQGAGDEFDIQWMPPGAQEITCFVRDEPREMDFTVKAEHAVMFNDMLQRLRARAAAGEEDEPFIDFNHEDGMASGRPTEMYWGGEDVKKGGIRLKGRWTGSGKAAVANKDFTRFSPEWHFDKETDEPVGIGVNLGGLVNRAAFKTMAAVAKSAAETKKQRTDKMTAEEYGKIVADALKPIGERLTALEAKGKSAETEAATAQATAADQKIIKLIQDANKPLLEKMEALDKRDKEAATAKAKAAVQVHVNRGAIAPEDKDTIEFYQAGYLVDADKAEKAMAKLPGKSFRGMTSASGGQAAAAAAAASGEPQHVFIAKAKEFGKTNKIENESEALVAFGRSAEGRALYEDFRRNYVTKGAAKN